MPNTTIPLIAHVQAYGKDGATSAAIDTTGASLLIVHIAFDKSAVLPTVTDSKGNNWNPLITSDATGAVKSKFFYAWNPIVGPSHTFTVGGTGIYCGFQVTARAGIITASDPFDGQTQAAVSTSNSIGIGGSPLTPSSSLSLVVSGIAWNPGQPGIGGASGFTLLDSLDMVPGSAYGSAILYEVVTSNAVVSNISAIATWPAAVNQIAVVTALFKGDPNYGGGGGATVTVPGAPTIGTAAPGDTTASFPFTAPASNGNATIDTYLLTVYKVSDNSPIGTFTGTTSPIAATGLTDGTGYYGKVAAHNTAGYGAQSAASNTVTPTAAAPTITGVAVSPTSANLTPGQTQPLTATASGTGAYNSGVTWSGTGAPYLDSTTANNATFTAPATLGTYTLTATASDGSHAASATVTVAAASGAITPPTSTRNPNPQDRVIDSTTTTGTGPVAAAGVSATGYRTLAAAYPSGGKGVPYVIESSDKSQWEAGLGTFSGGTLTRDTVLSSSQAGGLVNFNPGTKTIYCDLSARSAAVFAVKDYIDVRDFDADPNFSTDSTVGIQAAIQKAWDTRTSRVKFPDGRFKIGGAPNVSSAQLYIPNTKSTDQLRTIILEGSAPPNLELQGLVSAPVPTNGTILESTIVGSSGSSLLRGEAGWSGEGQIGRWNYTNFGVRNMGFRTKVDTGANPMTALDLGYFSQIVELHNVRVDVNVPLINSPDPSAVNSSGIILPPTDNHANFQLTGVTLIGGFTNGVVGSEHTQINKLSVLCCTNALVLTDTNHASQINHLHVECSKNSILLQGNHPIMIGTYSCEHFGGAQWYAFASDIKFTGSGANTSGGSPPRKVVIVSSTVVKSSIGVVDEFIVNGVPNGVLIHKVIVGAGAN